MSVFSTVRGGQRKGNHLTWWWRDTVRERGSAVQEIPAEIATRRMTGADVFVKNLTETNGMSYLKVLNGTIS